MFWPKIALTRLSRLGYLRLQVTQRMTKPAAYQAPSGGQTPLGRVVGGVLVIFSKRATVPSHDRLSRGKDGASVSFPG